MMEKRTLRSEEEHRGLRRELSLGYSHGPDGTRHCLIGHDGSGMKSMLLVRASDGTDIVVDREPRSYPCVMVWHRETGERDTCVGSFVYPDDFKEISKTDNKNNKKKH